MSAGKSVVATIRLLINAAAAKPAPPGKAIKLELRVHVGP